MKRPSSTLCLAVLLCHLAVAQTQDASPTPTKTPGANSSTAVTKPSTTITDFATVTGTEIVTELEGGGADLTTEFAVRQTTKSTTVAPLIGTTKAQAEDCGGVLCGLNEVCVDQTVDNITSKICQCLPDYIRINETACQDPAVATCETVSCGEPPASCTDDENGVFSGCVCGDFQILKEGICVETPKPTGSSVAPTTGAGSNPTTRGPTQTAKGTTRPAAKGTTKPAGEGSTKAVGAVTTVHPDSKPKPTRKSYAGPILGLFIFLVITTLVFVAIYVVRKRKLRNNYGRLDEDSSEGGWSAFSKNPIYRGDRDYQPL